MNLIERCQKMIDELGIPLAAFCRNIGISTSYFYACKNGRIDFSKTVAAHINNYLVKYGF